MLQGKRLILGITGSIAAYKAVELMRLFQAQGARVQCCLTKGASGFITPLTFSSLSHQPCIVQSEEGNIAHIEAAQSADVLVIAPASANSIAKLAHGFADEPLYQLALSFRGPIVLAPAMETQMWQHPATIANVHILKQRGVKVVEPESGELASGRLGEGRLAQPDVVLYATQAALCQQDFAGKRVLLTVGPTQEAIDPVRFISNRSSGKMGTSLAKAFWLRGACVTVIHGPMSVSLPRLPNLQYIGVQSADQMYAQVESRVSEQDIVVCCAAVADYKPIEVFAHKLKKTQVSFTLNLEKTPDILKAIGQLPYKPFLVGFAAETQHILEYGLEKCRSKNCDLLCVNDVSQEGIGFESDANEMMLVNQFGPVRFLHKAPKLMLAHQIADVIVVEAARQFA